jgi:hypothetical protein
LKGISGIIQNIASTHFIYDSEGEADGQVFYLVVALHLTSSPACSFLDRKITALLFKF